MINTLSATHPEGSAFNTRSRTAQQHLSNDPIPHTNATEPVIPETGHTTLKSLSADKLDALHHIQKKDPFCKHISKCLSNRKSTKHEADLFIHVKGLLYKHVTDSHQKFLPLVTPKAWKLMVLVEVHDKLGCQGSTWTYYLIKWQYY